MREHLAQCEACRSVVAGFESEANAGHTIVDDALARSGQATFYHDPRKDAELDGGSAAEPTIPIKAASTKEDARSDRGFEDPKSTREAQPRYQIRFDVDVRDHAG